MKLHHGLYIYGAAMMVFLVGPILAIVPISFSGSGFLSYPISDLTLRWYARVLQPVPWLTALKNSLIVASGTTVLATVLGTLAALGLTQSASRARSALLAFIVSPMIVPSVVSGVGMFFLFARMGLNASYAGLILAHTVLGTPFVVVTVAATLQNFDRNLLRAASSLGASPVVAFFTVTLPIISSGVIAGALFAFVISLDEIIVALFIGGPAHRTLPRQMFDGIRDNIDPSILAMSTLLILATVALVLALAFISRVQSRLRSTVQE